MHRAKERPRGHRLASALLGVLILAGSMSLVAIPVGWLWMLSQLGQPYGAVYFLALGGCPILMIAWGLVLVRLNRRYLSLEGDEDDSGRLLEASIAITVAIGVAILAAWLLLYPDGGGPVQGPWPG